MRAVAATSPPMSPLRQSLVNAPANQNAAQNLLANGGSCESEGNSRRVSESNSTRVSVSMSEKISMEKEVSSTTSSARESISKNGANTAVAISENQAIIVNNDSGNAGMIQKCVCRRVSIVFLSAFGGPEAIEEAKKVGGDGYLLKPISRKELLFTVEQFIGAP